MQDRDVPIEQPVIYNLFPLSEKAAKTAGDAIIPQYSDPNMDEELAANAIHETYNELTRMRGNPELLRWAVAAATTTSSGERISTAENETMIFKLQGAAFTHMALRLEAEQQGGIPPKITADDFDNIVSDLAESMFDNPHLKPGLIRTYIADNPSDKHVTEGAFSMLMPFLDDPEPSKIMFERL